MTINSKVGIWYFDKKIKGLVQDVEFIKLVFCYHFMYMSWFIFTILVKFYFSLKKGVYRFDVGFLVSVFCITFCIVFALFVLQYYWFVSLYIDITK